MTVAEEMIEVRRRAYDELVALRAENERWRRHGVLVTEDCGECDASGWLGSMMGGGSPKSCPVCDGSGKVLTDGAIRLPGHYWTDGKRTDDPEMAWVSFPASWLEGASDGD